ncbi:MAG: hypothetical protein K8I00_09745 [Candidatus Omnitrophica bacterium]|nr:hypothetical protein [Candidatus Omnitrophota bacterium]
MIRALIISICVLLLINPNTARAETLGEVVSRHNLGRYLPRLPADQPITSYATHEDLHEFLLAYYEWHPEDPNRLDDALRVVRIDKRAGRVTHSVISMNTALRPWGLSHLGSVLDVRKIGGRYYLKGHLNPSASPTLVLSEDLILGDVIPGWIVSSNKGRRIVYQHNEVHFAPPVETRYSVYHPRTMIIGAHHEP